VLFLTARDATEDKLPAVEDQAWFFDTELLLAAQRGGLRIHEVPVDWVEDTDSRVDVVRTALDNLRGMARVARQQLPSFAASRGSSTPSRTVNQATVTAKES
jgi:hypothetical protein